MDYVQMLRAAVGNRPLVLAGTCVLLFRRENDGEFLMQRRADNGLWSMPGGMIEPGEAAEETAAREVYEETGWQMTPPQLVTVVSGKETFYRYPNGDEVFSVTTVFAGLALARDREADASETKELKWWPIDEPVRDVGSPTKFMFEQSALSSSSLRRLLVSLPCT
ncbi:MAG: NUDIX domain-containing protein [Pseudomonadota bacterium]